MLLAVRLDRSADWKAKRFSAGSRCRSDLAAVSDSGADVARSFAYGAARSGGFPTPYACRRGKDEMPGMMVYFDTEADGHHPHHVAVLSRYAIRAGLENRLVFAIPEELKKRALEALGDLGEDERTCLRFHRLGDAEIRKVQEAGSPAIQHWRRWRLGIRSALETNAETVFFSVLDDVTLAAAFAPSPPVAVSGLAFRASMHYPEFRTGVKGRLRQSMKAFILRRVLGRKGLATLLTLDPYFAEYASRMLRGGHKVQFLPEPYDPPRPRVLAEKGRAKPVRFLFYGAMQRRKGILPLLDALDLLEPQIRDRAEFRFCGEGPMVAEIERRLSCLRSSGVRIDLAGRYLSQAELDAEIAAADAILAPYLDHAGSSGVLLTAAAYGKSVLSQDKGMIGREIECHRLGEAVDTHDPRAIAAGIGRLVVQAGSGSLREADIEAFLGRHGEAAFARTVMHLA